MKKRLKILNLVDIPWHSALADYALAQAEALEEAGCEIFFACGEKSHVSLKTAEKGWETLNVPDRKKFFTPLSLLSLKKFVEEKGIDALNAHTGRMQTVSYLLSFLSKRPFWIIRTKSDAKGIRKSLTYSRVSGVIAGSGYIKEMFVRTGLGKGKIKVAYRSPAPGLYAPPPAVKPFRVGLLGRLDPVKGHKDFIAAALLLLEKGKDAEFLMAGREENVKWRDLAGLIPAKFAEKFKYLGFAEDSAGFINSCHLGVIASTGSEAVSRAAMEWMNAGRLLISTDVGSLPELVGKEFLVPPWNPELLAKKINENLEPERLAKEGLKNLERMKEKFGLENFRKGTEAAFQEFCRISASGATGAGSYADGRISPSGGSAPQGPHVP